MARLEIPRRPIPLLLFLVSAACAGDKSGGKAVSGPPTGRVALLLPGKDTSGLKAPSVFKAKFETSKGTFIMEVHRDWAPLGADRFYYLVKNGFYDDVRFFRVVPNFMVQFGLSGDPKLSGVWRDQFIYDDSVKQSNKRGFVTYAKGGDNTRTTQIFINFRDNGSSLDRQGFAPFAQVIEGMEIVDQIYQGYGDSRPSGSGPEQGRVRAEGNVYLDRDFPKLDRVIKATVMEEPH